MATNLPLHSQCDGLNVPEWVTAIEAPLIHYFGYRWSAGVLPNNYIFYVRDTSTPFRLAAVTDSLHGRYELVIAIAGAGRVCLEDRVYPLAPGQALLVRPWQFHRYFGNDPFVWLLFGFDLDEDSDLIAEGDPARQLSEADMALLTETGGLLSHQPASNSALFTIALNMSELIRGMKDRPVINAVPEEGEAERNTLGLLRHVARFVDQHLEKSVRITDIADSLDISESNLRKMFRENFGVSLGAYLQRSRLGRGIQLVTGRNELSISEIAQLCGFQSIFSFSQVFSKAVGMSPSAYRRHIQAGGAPFKVGGMAALASDAAHRAPVEGD